jgi:hypothetical protein
MRYTLLVAALAAALTLTGCPNPNAIGVQKYGTVTATTVLASNSQPVANGQCYTHGDGTCMLTNVPVGPQVVSASATGLNGPPVSVNVTTENQNYPVTILMYPTN